MIRIERRGRSLDVREDDLGLHGAFTQADGEPLAVLCDPLIERRVASLIGVGEVDVLSFEVDPTFPVPPGERVADLGLRINRVLWVWLLEAKLWAPADLGDRWQVLAEISFEGVDFNGGSGESLSAWQDLRYYEGLYYETNDTDHLWASETDELVDECRSFFQRSEAWDVVNEIDHFLLRCSRLTVNELREYVRAFPETARTPDTVIRLYGCDGSIAIDAAGSALDSGA